MHADAISQVTDGGQPSIPWRSTRSVIGSVGPSGADFALPIRDG
jgi:hypothetical protein